MKRFPSKSVRSGKYIVKRPSTAETKLGNRISLLMCGVPEERIAEILKKPVTK